MRFDQIPWTPSLLRSPTRSGSGDENGDGEGSGVKVCVGIAVGGVSVEGAVIVGSASGVLITDVAREPVVGVG